MSKQAREILKVIRTADAHMTAEEIFLECKTQGIAVSIATVYRNLGIMVHDGTIRKISIAGEPDHYDKSLQPHEHFFCIRCKQLNDIWIEDLQRELEEKVGISLESYDLTMRAICPKCRKQQAS